MFMQLIHTMIINRQQQLVGTPLVHSLFHSNLIYHRNSNAMECQIRSLAPYGMVTNKRVLQGKSLGMHF